MTAMQIEGGPSEVFCTGFTRIRNPRCRNPIFFAQHRSESTEVRILKHRFLLATNDRCSAIPPSQSVMRIRGDSWGRSQDRRRNLELSRLGFPGEDIAPQASFAVIGTEPPCSPYEGYHSRIYSSLVLILIARAWDLVGEPLI